MKKLFTLFSLVAVLFALGTVQAYAAVPMIDGTSSSVLGDGATEWSNDRDGLGTPWTYYLEVFDINENAVNNPFGDIPDAYDIRRAVVIQELDDFGGDGNPANDGIYLLVETYGTYPSIIDNDGLGPLGAAVAISGSFDGGSTFTFFATHEAANPFTGAGQTVTVDNFFPLNPDGTPAGGTILGADLVTNLGAFAAADGNKTGTVGTVTALEYFFPTLTFGTPNLPFPSNFVGAITYDNSGQFSDDVIVGTLIPEPGTIFLLGAGLLGLVGFRRFGR
jgi:hypothetical protein